MQANDSVNFANARQSENPPLTDFFLRVLRFFAVVNANNL
jgi:hypothetical protein